jgi:hypothetical protein
MLQPDNETRRERFADFVEQCRIEETFLRATAHEITLLLADIGAATNDASLRDRAAAANLAQSFYNGIENILKRTSKYCGITLPKSEQWHNELAERFSEPLHRTFGLPLLITSEIISSITILRRFRHVIMHGYAMNLDWERMRVNIELIPDVFTHFQSALTNFLDQERQRFTPPPSKTADSPD